MMRRNEVYSNDQPRKRQFIREENPMYTGHDSMYTQSRGNPHANYIEIDADYEQETVFDNRGGTANTQLKYDYGMEELLQLLPSRQIEDVAETASRTLWRKHLGSSARQRGTLRIQKSDEFDKFVVENLLHDPPADYDDDEQLRSDIDQTVRTIPTTLSRKRTIRHKLSGKKGKNLTSWKLIKYKFAMQWQRAKHKVTNETRIFDLWGSHLKTIEGCFGTSVVSYFIFLKWVLLINIPIFLLTFSFLVIPQILYEHYQRPSSERHRSVQFEGIEILTGTGYFTDSEMYYGFYSSETVKVLSGSKYDLKYAYLLTCCGYYLFCLIILGYSYLRSYRKYYIEISGSLRLYYFNIVFCGWDYGITSQEAGHLKHRSIYNEFKEYLAGIKKSKIKSKKSQICKKWAIRLLVWLVVLGLLAGSGYVTYIVSTELSIKPNLANSTTTIASSLAMPFVISSIQLIIPIIFTLMETYEQFSSAKYELYVHMFREQLLRAAMLGVLVYFWLNLAPSQVSCWETFVGQEIYRLTIMDLIFGLIYSFFMEFIRKLCSLKWKSIKKTEFAIARHTLELIYTQSLCWLGIFYCPLLPVVVILKLIITFYVKRYSVTQNCRPSLKPWRASRTHTHFVGYIFIFFILTSVAIFFSIFEVQPSTDCGPYKNYTTSYKVITNLVHNWEHDYEVFGDIVSIINSPGFIYAVIVLLCVFLFYSRAIMKSRKKRVKQFKLQLLSEGKDKKYLLNQIHQARLNERARYNISQGHQGANYIDQGLLQEGHQSS